ncbi:MAG: hypothetical protein R3F43_27875 [bacterium]
MRPTIAVAAGFAAINVSPAFARAWEAALAWTPLPMGHHRGSVI